MHVSLSLYRTLFNLLSDTLLNLHELFLLSHLVENILCLVRLVLYVANCRSEPSVGVACGGRPGKNLISHSKHRWLLGRLKPTPLRVLSFQRGVHALSHFSRSHVLLQVRSSVLDLDL